MGLQHEVITIMVIAFGVLFLVAFFAMPWIVQGERRRQRKKAQSGTVGVFDEVFHPEAKNARVMWEAQTELPAPAPTPGDKPDLDGGHITIRLPQQ
ncbi:hypothetical protein GCM10022288_18130 [Gryllotalpicola kribbensis]|jgi:hypothetical protein|uniref:Uncharacterized protein n=1 Tax=Gryllotalpicola kribbensis TaxID=993084 RepID=A0ABP8ATN1_9MICO